MLDAIVNRRAGATRRLFAEARCAADSLSHRAFRAMCPHQLADIPFAREAAPRVR